MFDSYDADDLAVWADNENKRRREEGEPMFNSPRPEIAGALRAEIPPSPEGGDVRPRYHRPYTHAIRAVPCSWSHDGTPPATGTALVDVLGVEHPVCRPHELRLYREWNQAFDLAVAEGRWIDRAAQPPEACCPNWPHPRMAPGQDPYTCAQLATVYRMVAEVADDQYTETDETLYPEGHR